MILRYSRFVLAGILSTVLIVACSGGGGGSASPPVTPPPVTPPPEPPTPPPPTTQSVEINWSQPTTRENGVSLPLDELRGYVLLFFERSALQNEPAGIFGVIDSQAEFEANGSQIGNMLAAEQIEALISSGSPNTMVVNSATQTRHVFEELATGDTYYFAVSPFDAQSAYASVSNTVEVEL